MFQSLLSLRKIAVPNFFEAALCHPDWVLNTEKDISFQLKKKPRAICDFRDQIWMIKQKRSREDLNNE